MLSPKPKIYSHRSCLDTTVLELVSGICFAITGLLIFLGSIETGLWSHPIELWAALMLIFGLIQVYFITLNNDYFGLRIIRAVIALISGAFWIWLSLSHLAHNPDVVDIITLMFGISNMWAFAYNFLTSGTKFYTGDLKDGL